MNLGLIKNDKTLIKNGETIINLIDDAFCSNFNGVHAIHIDDNENTNEVELADGSYRLASEEEKNLISQRFDQAKNDIEVEKTNIFNSWERVKQSRDFWLASTDKIMLDDFPGSPSFKENIKTYRNNLRNLPSSYSRKEPRPLTFDDDGNVLVDENIVINYPND